ncbi:MAG: phytanoyl-CoA dioxygenase family protein [Pseudomonadota bacterium]
MSEKLYFDTLAPDAVSAELAPVIERLGLEENCRQLAMEGWTVVHDAATPEFNEQLRATILDLCAARGGGQMLLHKDPVFAEAVLNPSLQAMAEYSVGRGFLLSQVAASVRPKGSKPIGLHADNNWLPAPFPAHNMLLTACWACDEYTREGGSTLVIPGSANLRRHPNAEETEALQGAIAIECPAGSIAMWDGNVWHSNYPREIDGDRVVCHITYSRLMMRPVENYQQWADELVATHGGSMAQMLGRHDFLDSATGADYSKIPETFNNAKR